MPISAASITPFDDNGHYVKYSYVLSKLRKFFDVNNLGDTE